MFKSLICLFLTTSFLVLDLDNKNEEKALETEYRNVSTAEYDEYGALHVHLSNNDIYGNSTSDETYDAMGSASNYPF